MAVPIVPRAHGHRRRLRCIPGQSSFLCIIETPDGVAYGVIANDVHSPGQPSSLYAPRVSAIWPGWRSVKGDLAYIRVANYIFQPRAGYIEMCKSLRTARWNRNSKAFPAPSMSIAQ